jgi:alpha-mannosidase
MQKIYMIGNAHLDIVWLWRFELGLQEIRATFQSAIDRIKEYDDFVFTSNCSSYYEFVEDTDVRLFTQIQEAVKEGKWYISGGWYLQPDCNIPAGESFIRQGLYGQHYFKEKFGVQATVGYNVDSFGHHGNMPQILKHLGLDKYVFMRPNEMENGAVPASAFSWEGIDGTVVPTFRIPISYLSEGGNPEELIQKIHDTMAIADAEGTPLMCFYGVGNHGGGPTKINIETIQTFQQGALGKRVLFSHPGAYFDDLNTSNLPRYRGELQHHAIGCYSVIADIKRLHSRTEQALMQSEILSSVFEPTIGSVPATSQLKDAWKRVLLNEFHDTVSGTSLPEAYTEACQSLGYAIDVADTIRYYVTQRVASRIDTSDGNMRLIVFNPHSWTVRESVIMDSIVDGIYDEAGAPVTWQIVRSNATTGGMYAWNTLVKVEVPALGYRTYVLENARTREEAQAHAWRLFTVDPSPSFGNEKITVSRSYKDSNSVGRVSFNEREFLSAINPVVIEDFSDTWSHNFNAYSGLERPMELTSVAVKETGDLRTTYVYTYCFGNSTLTLMASVTAGEEKIDLNVRVFWAEKHSVLKLCFQSPSKSGKFVSEIPYGWIERPANGTEWPCQRWIGSTWGNGESLFILNDGLYGCSAKEGRLEMTLLRSPISAHHMPVVPTAEPWVRYTDQGEHEWNMALLFSNIFAPERATRAAHQLCRRPTVFIESIHEGDLPASASFGSVDSDSVIIETIKRAEQGDGYIIRLVECAGKATTATVTIPGICDTTKLLLRQFEIVTLLCSHMKAHRVNGLEERL